MQDVKCVPSLVGASSRASCLRVATSAALAAAFARRCFDLREGLLAPAVQFTTMHRFVGQTFPDTLFNFQFPHSNLRQHGHIVTRWICRSPSPSYAQNSTPALRPELSEPSSSISQVLALKCFFPATGVPMLAVGAAVPATPAINTAAPMKPLRLEVHCTNAATLLYLQRHKEPQQRPLCTHHCPVS
jgi:hypothetical protein